MAKSGIIDQRMLYSKAILLLCERVLPIENRVNETD